VKRPEICNCRAPDKLLFDLSGAKNAGFATRQPFVWPAQAPGACRSEILRGRVHAVEIREVEETESFANEGELDSLTYDELPANAEIDIPSRAREGVPRDSGNAPAKARAGIVHQASGDAPVWSTRRKAMPPVPAVRWRQLR